MKCEHCGGLGDTCASCGAPVVGGECAIHETERLLLSAVREADYNGRKWPGSPCEQSALERVRMFSAALIALRPYPTIKDCFLAPTKLDERS